MQAEYDVWKTRTVEDLEVVYLWDIAAERFI
jgi:hypothetical protein